MATAPHSVVSNNNYWNLCQAVTFLGRLTRLKKKTIVKHKLYLPMINVIFRYQRLISLQETIKPSKHKLLKKCLALQFSPFIFPPPGANWAPPDMRMTPPWSHVLCDPRSSLSPTWYSRTGHSTWAAPRNCFGLRYLLHNLSLLSRFLLQNKYEGKF